MEILRNFDKYAKAKERKKKKKILFVRLKARALSLSFLLPVFLSLSLKPERSHTKCKFLAVHFLCFRLLQLPHC